MSTQGARNCEAGRCHAKSTHFDLLSVLTAVRPYSSSASPRFSVLVCSMGISPYTLWVIIRICKSRVLDASDQMLISIGYGSCGPCIGDKKGINNWRCLLPTPRPLGRTSYSYSCLCVVAGTHRTNIYNSESSIREKTLDILIKHMYYFSLSLFSFFIIKRELWGWLLLEEVVIFSFQGLKSRIGKPYWFGISQWHGREDSGELTSLVREAGKDQVLYKDHL